MGQNYNKNTKEYKKLENLTNRIINENYKFLVMVNLFLI